MADTRRNGDSQTASFQRFQTTLDGAKGLEGPARVTHARIHSGVHSPGVQFIA